MKLTEAGLSYSRLIAARLDEVERDTLSIMTRRGQGGTLDLAVVPSFATKWLLPRLRDFLQTRPDAEINLNNRTRPFSFQDSDFDAAIYCGEANWPGTRSIFVIREKQVPVFIPAFLPSLPARSAEAIAALPLLQQATRPYAWRQWFLSFGLRVPHDMTGSRFELFSMLAQGAMSGMGVALIPPMLIEEELRDGRLVIPVACEYFSDRAYYLIFPEQHSESSLFDAFRDWLAGEAKAYRDALGLG
jgi:LysR family glycine cleavage system transcriptional activator